MNWDDTTKAAVKLIVAGAALITALQVVTCELHTSVNTRLPPIGTLNDEQANQTLPERQPEPIQDDSTEGACC